MGGLPRAQGKGPRPSSKASTRFPESRGDSSPRWERRTSATLNKCPKPKNVIDCVIDEINYLSIRK